MRKSGQRRTLKAFIERSLRQASARLCRLTLGILTAVVVLTAAPQANAQSRTWYHDRLQLSGDPDDGFYVWRPKQYERMRFYGMWALGYAVHTLRDETVTRDAGTQAAIGNPLNNRMITYLHGGVELLQRLSVNVALPVILFQNGDADPLQFGVGDGLDRGSAAGDLRLDARVLAWQADSGLFRIGGGGALFFPTGNADAFASDDEVTGYIYGSAEFDFKKFLMAGTIGPHFRPSRALGGANSSLALGSDLRITAGAYLPLRDDKVRIGGEVLLTTGITKEGTAITGEERKFFEKQNTDFEWLGSIRFALDQKNRWYVMGGAGTRLASGYGAPDFRALVSVGTWMPIGRSEVVQAPKPRRKSILHDPAPDSDGDGLPDDIDMCPMEKEDGKPPNTDDGCPAEADADGDGIPDASDKCPNEPEDRDGIDDADGCPEKDADNDGILDAKDSCPKVPGIASQIAEKHGCPSLIRREEGDDQLVLLEPIQFNTGRSTIKPVSFKILNEVVALLKARKGMRMAIHGHTDSRGGYDMNMRLSKDRAASVVRYIVGKGVAGDRLESDGFGPDKPVSDNNTAQGRAKNRRVDFIIIDEGD